MSLLNNLIGRLKAIFRRAPPSGDFADLSVDEVVGSMLQAMGGITLDAYVDGDYLAGVWLLDQVWSKKQSVLPSALIFYSRGYCKKLDRFRTDWDGFDTAVSGFSYSIEGDRLISMPMDESEEIDESNPEAQDLPQETTNWKFEEGRLWIFDEEWLPFRSATMAELIEAGLDPGPVKYAYTMARVADPNFRERVELLPLHSRPD
jgi:hypothetical protein